MRITGILTCLLLIIGISSCGTQENNSKQTVNTKSEMSAKTDKAINVDLKELATLKDPVCGMNMANFAITDTAKYKGLAFPFCSSACKKIFTEDPITYAKVR